MSNTPATPRTAAALVTLAVLGGTPYAATLVAGTLTDGTYAAWVVGGLLPDGNDYERCATLADAALFAAAVAAALVTEAAELSE